MTRILKRVLCGWLLVLSFCAVATPSKFFAEDTEQTKEEESLVHKGDESYGTGG